MGHRSSIPKPEHEWGGMHRTSSQLAVIIPTLNEANNIEATIHSIHVPDIVPRFQPEVLVVDGGSSDDTVAIAKQAGCKVLQTAPGRGHQMNLGWQATNRTWCLFLHGDTQLPAGYFNALHPIIATHQPAHKHAGAGQDVRFEHGNQQHVRRRWWWHRNRHRNSQHDPMRQDMNNTEQTSKQTNEGVSPAWQQDGDTASAQQGCGHLQNQLKRYFNHHSPLWGCFKTIQTMDWADTWHGKLLSGGVALRTRLCGLPYGDQGIFVARHVLEKAGGLPNWPLLEDVELVKRCKQVTGQPPYILPLPIKTSGRRWETLGFWRTAFINQAILIGWAIGIPPHQLAVWYYTAKRRNTNHNECTS